MTWEMIADTREDIKIIEQLEKIGYSVTIKPLEISDYCYQNVGVERKSNDFINLSDVQMKARELSSAFPYHFLIVENNLDALIKIANNSYRQKDMTQPMLGLVASLAVGGTPPIFTSNKYFFTTIMHKIFQKATDGKDRGEGIQALRPVAKSSDYYVRILSGMPGISAVLAERLIEQFSTIGAICKATAKEIEEIEGFGENRAETVKTYFH